jgi:hypothetical protein
MKANMSDMMPRNMRVRIPVMVRNILVVLEGVSML